MLRDNDIQVHHEHDHAFVMAGKLLLIRLYFNGKWRELNSGKIFIEKILDKKNRNCDYRDEL